MAKLAPLPRTEMDALLLGRLDELTVSESNSKGKNYLSALLSIVVLLLISSMIVAAIVIINPEITNFQPKHYAPREAITLEESLMGELSPLDFQFQWLKQSRKETQDKTSGSRRQVDELLFEDAKNINIMQMPFLDDKTHGLTTHISIVRDNAQTPNSTEQAANLFYARRRTNNSRQIPAALKPKARTLVANSSLLSTTGYQGYKISPSKRYLLIWSRKRRQFRHSFTARYYIYDIELDLISMLSTQPLRPSILTSPLGSDGYSDANTSEDFDEEFRRFQLVSWYSRLDGNGSFVDSLAMVQRNDIFLMTDISSSAPIGVNSNSTNQTNSPKRVTFTGRANEIFNGVPDWLYEEEILGDSPAFRASPNGNRIAYMSFNDSLVSLMPYSIYGNSDQVIPRVQQIRYPKPGRVNPRVSVHILEQTSTRDSQFRDIKLNLPAELASRQHYISRVNWLTNDKLALIWLSRSQNDSHILICSPDDNRNWICEKNLHLTAPGGWLEFGDDLIPYNEQYYLTLVPKFEGKDVGSFKHVARVSIDRPNEFVFLTSGRKEVTSIKGVDPQRSLVYYLSTVEGEPGQRQFFSASLTPPASGELHSTCITCHLYPDECLFNYAEMSQSTQFYIFECAGPGVPRTELRTTIATPELLNFGFLHTNPEIVDVIVPESKSRPLDSLAPSSQQPLSSSSPASSSSASSSSSAASDKVSVSGPNVEISKTIDSALGQPPRFANILAPIGSQAKQDQQSRQSATADCADDPSKCSQQQQQQQPPAQPIDGDPNLLWVIEDNRVLRDQLSQHKVMPLTMRLKVPIPDTNYTANVLLLLPPQLGPMTSFRATPNGGADSATTAATASSAGGANPRPRRHAGSKNLNGLELPLHAYFTPESIGEYAEQLNSGQQYPMIVDVYAGPGSQRVDYRFNVHFGHYMASRRRTVYAMIDGRGSGYQGSKRLFELRHNLGTVEIQDQISTADQLAKQLSFIDPNKVAIWGWSYGGYAAAMALAQSNAQALRLFESQLRDMKLLNNNNNNNNNNNLNNGTTGTNNSNHTISLNDVLLRHHHMNHNHQPRVSASMPPLPSLHGVFECAVSVAPVTNWIYYDTAYTERYMSSPYESELYDNIENGDHNQAAPATAKRQDDSLLNKMSSLNRLSSLDPISRAPSNKWIAMNQTSMVDSMASSQLLEQAADMRSNLSPVTGTSQTLNLNERYHKASLLEQIGNIDRKRFMLIHGTADDNVHFQQSIMLMKSLIHRNVLFETRIYPDQDHGIENKADKLHLGATLTSFFAECFDVVE